MLVPMEKVKIRFNNGGRELVVPAIYISESKQYQIMDGTLIDEKDVIEVLEV